MHFPAENGDDSDSDEELEMGGVTQKFLCPITLTPLANPVTSLVSSVSFDHTFFDLRSAKYVDTVSAEMQFCRYLKILRCRKGALLLGAISAFGFWIACRMRHSRRRSRFTNVANVLPRSIAMPRKWWIDRVLFL